ncbi:MAG: hypothetical protein J0I06_19185, partial [Planctomycetes bacterium]|nr:hypothetical protein [Planctomycetota bacterium]
MAPEQARAPASADVRADLYSLGCTLYFLLAGRAPFAGGSPLQTLLDHQDAAPRPIPGLPAPVAAVLRRLLEKDPARRFATPAELADVLEKLAAPPPSPNAPRPNGRRSWRGVGIGAVVLVGAVAVAVALVPRNHPVDPPTEATRAGPSAVEPAPAAPAPPALERALAPPPRAVDRDALATPEQFAAWKRESAYRLVDWVRENNRWDPAAPVVASTAEMIAEAAPKSNGFSLALGGALVRSGKPTLIETRIDG